MLTFGSGFSVLPPDRRRMKENVAIDLELADDLLSFGRGDPLYQFHRVVVIDVFVVFRIDRDDVVWIVEFFVSFEERLEVDLLLESEIGPAVGEAVGETVGAWEALVVVVVVAVA